MPIKSIQLVNFQSHKDSLLEFSPKINAIVGASDQGKSVIMRAFHSVIYNRPSGDDMVSDWIKDTKGKIKKGREMRITLRNADHTIERFRNDQNGYMVDGTRMEAIRTDVPQMVSDALNIGDVNVQKQMDAPFLISCSGGETARFINKMVNLEEIDTYLSEMSIFVNQANKDVELEKVSIKEKETALQEFGWIEALAPVVEALEMNDFNSSVIEKKVALIDVEMEDAESASMQIRAYQREIEQAQALVAKIKKLDVQTGKVATQFNEAIISIDRYNSAQASLKLCDGLEMIVNLVDKIKKLDAQISKLPSAELLETSLLTHHTNAQWLHLDDTKAIACVGKVKALDIKIHSMLDETKALGLSKDSYIIEAEKIATLQTEITTLEASRPKACPTCGRSYEHQHAGE